MIFRCASGYAQRIVSRTEDVRAQCVFSRIYLISVNCSETKISLDISQEIEHAFTKRFTEFLVNLILRLGIRLESTITLAETMSLIMVGLLRRLSAALNDLGRFTYLWRCRTFILITRNDPSRPRVFNRTFPPSRNTICFTIRINL